MNKYKFHEESYSHLLEFYKEVNNTNENTERAQNSVWKQIYQQVRYFIIIIITWDMYRYLCVGQRLDIFVRHFDEECLQY